MVDNRGDNLNQNNSGSGVNNENTRVGEPNYNNSNQNQIKAPINKAASLKTEDSPSTLDSSAISGDPTAPAAQSKINDNNTKDKQEELKKGFANFNDMSKQTYEAKTYAEIEEDKGKKDAAIPSNISGTTTGRDATYNQPSNHDISSINEVGDISNRQEVGNEIKQEKNSSSTNISAPVAGNESGNDATQNNNENLERKLDTNQSDQNLNKLQDPNQSSQERQTYVKKNEVQQNSAQEPIKTQVNTTTATSVPSITEQSPTN